MPTTILTLVQDFTDRMGLPTPTAIVGSQEKGVKQFKALLQKTVADLSEYRWSQQRLRTTWTSVAGQDQGEILTIFGPSWAGFEDATMWNESRRMRIYGPLPDAIWQALQILPNAGPEFQFWVSGGHLYVSPAQVAGETLSVIYISQYLILDMDGVTTKPLIAADSDSILFPDNVVSPWFESLWRRQKGEANWVTFKNEAMSLLAKNIVREGAATLSLDTPNRLPIPGIIIPAGSWNV